MSEVTTLLCHSEVNFWVSVYLYNIRLSLFSLLTFQIVPSMICLVIRHHLTTDCGVVSNKHLSFVDKYQTFLGRPGLIRIDGIHHTDDGLLYLEIWSLFENQNPDNPRLCPIDRVAILHPSQCKIQYEIIVPSPQWSLSYIGGAHSTV